MASTSVLASDLVPAPQELVNNPADFRFEQALQGDQTGFSSADGIISQTGLHWSSASDTALHSGRIPSSVLALSDEIQHVVLADLAERRLYLLENQGQLRVLRHMYATIGKNGTRKSIQDDGRTPVGVYTVTRYIDDPALPELYGAGAFPVDYPNTWDQHAGRTGYGIWLHGVPRDHYTRPPLSSEGCVAVGNEDFNSLKPFITPQNTRVIFTDQLRWLEPEVQQARQQEFTARLEAWRTAWNARDTDAYLSFYADDFSTSDMTRTQFAAHKQRVNAHKSFILVEISQLSVFDYPEQDEMRLVEFLQDYRSDTYNSVSAKRQFWRRDVDGEWRIVLETAAG